MPMSTKFDGEKSIIALMANELIKYIIIVVVVVVVGSKTPNDECS